MALEQAYTDPENCGPTTPNCLLRRRGRSVANRRAIYQKLVRDYPRCAAAIDDIIGRLLRTLDEEGLVMENTVVIYVSIRLLPRRARILHKRIIRGTAAHALRDPLPEGDSAEPATGTSSPPSIS
ncbi:MAG: hypothetical protein ACLRMJ_05650 [Alistipes finegoldii]